ncbi:hypothetical protein HanRHA438_Chr13g0609401 [Helianthus annuus]|nr:hypothetical protein HanRHA438_Chr13g0609401 [Helianthus annuus]
MSSEEQWAFNPKVFFPNSNGSDASFGYTGCLILYKTLNIGIDLDSRCRIRLVWFTRSSFHHCRQRFVKTYHPNSSRIFFFFGIHHTRPHHLLSFKSLTLSAILRCYLNFEDNHDNQACYFFIPFSIYVQFFHLFYVY